MLEFDDALRRIVGAASRLDAERVALPHALGRVLAEPLIARHRLPDFDYSAMDGYALRTADLRGDGPWSLPISSESRTGRTAPKLEAATSCRIFTGAPLPDGADSVVIQENVEVIDGKANFSVRPRCDDHVRRAGEDIQEGQVALAAGQRLGANHLALAAALDCTTLSIVRRPRVCIVCTGNELRPPGEPPFAGSVADSNGIAIAAMARQAGATARLAPLTGDDEAATAKVVDQALDSSDLLVTVGGVSVGDYDVVRPALQAAGATLEFWKVRIKPGKPLVFGRRGKSLVLGLPGNPVSAQVTFGLFGMPLLRALQGDSERGVRFRRLRLVAPVRQQPGRRGFYRAKLDGDAVVALENQASGAATSMAWADALVMVPPDSQGYEAGEMVSVILLRDL